ncbi:MAG: cytochrome oxidase small assembly protein [Pseudomonadota bacterium]
MSDLKKPNNRKTGLILAAVALLFFLVLFIKRIWFS